MRKALQAWLLETHYFQVWSVHLKNLSVAYNCCISYHGQLHSVPLDMNAADELVYLQYIH